MNKNKFRKKLHETVAETLSHMEVLSEMAVPLKKYKDRVDGLRFQIVENWCLCKYCQLFEPHNQNFAHWVNELKACINNLKLLNIKNNIDKRQVLQKMLVEEFDYNDSSMIARIIDDKFAVEGIVNVSAKGIICKCFANSIEYLINAIANEGISTDVYLQSAFCPSKNLS